MAVTSLWAIKGYMGTVIDYVENPDKTDNPERITQGEKASETLDDVISYASREEATNLRQLVYGLNVDPDHARQQMMAVKKKFGKEDGTIAYHGYQSFAEGEVTPELAHKIGIRLAEELWGDRFQVLICTHLDKASHIHNHFLINTVSKDDGKKFFRSNQDYRRMREVSDRLCREYGLSVIRHPEGKGKNYSEWSAEKNGKPTYRSMVRKDIDAAVRASLTDREFFRYLEKLGYEFKLYSKSGKELERPSLKPKGAERFFRFDRLGDEYSLDEIRERILENIRREVPFPEEDRQKIIKYRSEHPPHTKSRGIAALYYYYCYELHIIVKYPASAKQVSFFVREDLRKLDQLDAQVRFLGENHIETIDDLNTYRIQAKEKIRILEWERQVQRNILKRDVRAADVPKQINTKMKIAGITEEIGRMRKSLTVCDRVEKRSGQVAEELEMLNNSLSERGEQRDEQFRRRSGTGREDVLKRH